MIQNAIRDAPEGALHWGTSSASAQVEQRNAWSHLQWTTMFSYVCFSESVKTKQTICLEKPMHTAVPA